MKKKTEQLKYGLILEPLKDSDFVFGGPNVPYEELVSDGNWEPYLPVKEFQNLNAIEPYACVPFTLLNCLEALVKRKYGEDRNWSDRFLAALVDTRNGGTSPQKACDMLRHDGVPPQEVWPFSPDIDTTDKFFALFPQSVMEIAKEFLTEYEFRYERVPINPAAITSALRCSPLLFSVYAWVEKDGVYYRPEGMTDIHATTLFYEREGAFRRMFDSYDAPHIKDYKWGDLPMMCMRFWIEKKKVLAQKKSWFEGLRTFFRAFLSPKEAKEATRNLEPVLLPTETSKDKLKRICVESLHQDASPLNAAPSAYACAEGLSTLLQQVFFDFPITVSTTKLYQRLLVDDRFEKTLDIEPWDIIISPTGYGNKIVPNGHCGIVGENEMLIYSNNSNSGLWDTHLSLAAWIDRYRIKGQYPIFSFRIKS